MKASVGDRLVVRGHSVGAHVHDGEILEVVGDDGEPPYVVRWSDDGRVSRIFPGSDAYVERLSRRTARSPKPLSASRR
jgi:hypothetical protein